MKKILATFIFAFTINLLFSQALPVEIMTGNLYSTVNTITSKKLSQESKFGYFHLHTLQIDNKSSAANDLILQDLLYFEPIKHFRMTAGSFYNIYAGFAPSLGLQYVQNTKNLFVLISPKVNLYHDAQYDFFSVVQYKPSLTEKVKLYSRLQLLNVFGSEGNIKSYQWVRLGMEVKGIQFGLAVDLDQLGPTPFTQANWGSLSERRYFNFEEAGLGSDSAVTISGKPLSIFESLFPHRFSR